MDEKNIEELKILERAEKIVERLFKALYCEDDGDTIDYPTIMCALGKFTASVLLAVQEQGKVLDVEEDFMKAVMEVKESLTKPNTLSAPRGCCNEGTFIRSPLSTMPP